MLLKTPVLDIDRCVFVFLLWKEAEVPGENQWIRPGDRKTISHTGAVDRIRSTKTSCM